MTKNCCLFFKIQAMTKNCFVSNSNNDYDMTTFIISYIHLNWEETCSKYSFIENRTLSKTTFFIDRLNY